MPNVIIMINSDLLEVCFGKVDSRQRNTLKYKNYLARRILWVGDKSAMIGRTQK